MLTIGEVSELTGLATSALRYYEREGLIPAVDRRGGRRIYGDDILDRLGLIGRRQRCDARASDGCASGC